MAVVGTGEVKIEPDFSGFNALLKSGLIAGFASLGPSLAPALGVLAAVPAAAAAAGTSLVTLKLGFEGVGKALKDSSTNAKAFQKDMENLQPAQRAFVKQLIDLRPQIDGIKRSVANGLFPGVSAGLKAATGDLGIVKKALHDNAQELGLLAQRAGQMISSPAWKKDLPGLFRSVNDLVIIVGSGFLHVIDGIKNVAVAAEPLVRYLAGAFDRLTIKFDEWTKSKRGQTEMKNFLQGTIDTLKHLFSIMGSVAGIAKDLLAPFFPQGKPSETPLAAVDTHLKNIKRYLDGVDPAKLKAITLIAGGTAIAAKTGALGGVARLAGSLAPALATPAGAVVGAAAAVGIGGYELYKHNQGFHDFIDKTIGETKRLAIEAAPAVKGWVGNVKNNFLEFGKSILPGIKGFLSDFSKFWGQEFGPNGEGTKFVKAFMNAIGPIFTSVKKIVGDAFTIIGQLIKDALAVIEFIWHHWGKQILDVVFSTFRFIIDFIKGVWKILADIFDVVRDLLTGKWGKLWKDIKNLLKDAWDFIKNIFSDLLDLAGKIFSLIWSVIKKLWADLWTGIKNVASAAWGWLKSLFNTIVSGVAHFFQWIWDGIKSIWNSMWTWVKNTAKDAWDGIVNFFTNTAPHAIASAFGAIVKAAKFIWDGIKKVFGEPVYFVVHSIINPLINGADVLLSHLGLRIPPIPEKSIPHFSTGGTVPGSHSRDNVPIYATPGEVVVPKPIVNAHGGPGAVMSKLGFGGGGGLGGHYAKGGPVLHLGNFVGSDGLAMAPDGNVIIGYKPYTEAKAGTVRELTTHGGPGGTPTFGIHQESIGHALKDFVGTVAHWVRVGAANALNTAVLKPLGAAAHLLDNLGPLGKGFDHFVHDVLTGVFDFIRGKEKADPKPKLGVGGAYTGNRNWSALVQSTLTQLHSPSSLDAVLARIAFESGGNPLAVNLSDSNAAAGHPSVGLLQEIRSTFQGNAGPYRTVGPFLYGVSVDPQANIYAGIHYADARYGGMPDPRITHQGYAYGGVVRGPGGPRGDKIGIYASDGEFVVNARATAANLPFLKTINNSYATGGQVSFTHAQTLTLDNVIAAIVKALASPLATIKTREKSESDAIYRAIYAPYQKDLNKIASDQKKIAQDQAKIADLRKHENKKNHDRTEAAIRKLHGTMHDLTHEVTTLHGHMSTANKVWKQVHETMVRRDAQLNKYASARDAVATRLAAANTSLKTQQANRAAEVGTVAGTAGAFDFTQGGGQPGLTAGGIVSNLRQTIANVKTFYGLLKTLRKKGIPVSIIQQLGEAGPVQGMASAQALSAATPAEVKELTSDVKQLKGVATSTGNEVAGAMYDAGIKSTEGLIRGLKSKEKVLNAAMKRIADDMAKEIKKELKIHSPSETFAELGEYVSQGMAHGVTRGSHAPEDAVRRMAGRMGGAARNGPMQHVEHQHVYTPSDADLIARKLALAAYGEV